MKLKNNASKFLNELANKGWEKIRNTTDGLIEKII